MCSPNQTCSINWPLECNGLTLLEAIVSRCIVKSYRCLIFSSTRNIIQITKQTGANLTTCTKKGQILNSFVQLLKTFSDLLLCSVCLYFSFYNVLFSLFTFLFLPRQLSNIFLIQFVLLFLFV